MKNLKGPTTHILLLFGAFVLGLAFRLIRLGVLPLTNMEAETALEALFIANGSSTHFGPHMTYVGLTSLDFLIFSTGNFLARFWPALIGALIVFVPFLFRDRIGRWPATIASLLLATSPEMVAVSRIIGSPMMAFVFLLLGIGFMIRRRPIFLGFSLALGLMSGPGFWMGVVILGLSYLTSEWLFNGSEVFSLPRLENRQVFLVRLGISFGVSILVVGTSFFLMPEGLSGVFSGLVDFFGGFAKSRSFPFILLPLTIVAYSLGALVFGIWGGLRGLLVRNKLDMFLFIWSMVGFAFVLLYPASTPADLIWAILPLWILSARVVFFAWRWPRHSRLIAIITAALVVTISAFMLLALRLLVTPNINQNQQLNAFIALVGGVVLLLAIILLVNYGWSDRVALAGLLIGLSLVLCAGLISLSVNSTGLGPEVSQGLWYPNQATLSPEWLTISIDRIIDWNASGGQQVDIVVSDFDSAGIRWALRDYDPIHFVTVLSPQMQPGILITRIEDIPEISNSYRGQDLVWSRGAFWEGMSPSQYLQWLITRDAPTSSGKIIFWVRTDLMPDDQFTP